MASGRTLSAMSTIEAVTFRSGADYVNGALLLADGTKPHSTLVLLHGFPGVERNFDLAHEARRAGWNVLVFHYRGAWGSGGRFSFTSSHDDAPAALAFLRSSEAAVRYHIDPDRIAIAGHSMGGFIALQTAANDWRVLGAASWAGFNFGSFAPEAARDRERIAEAWGGNLHPLHGASGSALVEEVIASGSAWDLRNLSDAFRDRPVLLVGAKHDAVAPVAMHHGPLVDAYTNAVLRLTHAVLDTEHGFTSHRPVLSRMLLQWLGSL